MNDDTSVEGVFSSPLDEGEDKSSHVEAEPPEVVVPTVPSSSRRAWIVWLEVVAVLALTTPLFGSHSLIDVVCEAIGLRDTTTNFYLPSILHYTFVAVVTLAAMRLAGDSWSEFGIRKPTVTDIIAGSAVCVINWGLTMMGVSIIIDILKSIYSERYIYQITHVHSTPLHVQGWSGLVLLFVLSIAIGFSEELVARSYVIPRLERLLHSTWASVFVSAVVFGLLHWRSGILNTCHALLAGIVYGIAFVWTRRLWPVAIAHAVYDFSAFLSHAG